MPVRIKFCGITRVEDARQAVAIGADALGFVFHAPSPRYVDPAAAAGIIRTLPPFICKVGLFVNTAPDTVVGIAAATGIDVVQYHGDESPAECNAGPRTWIKAIRMRPGLDAVEESVRYEGASAILYDAYDPALYGGSGRRFDWYGVPQACPWPVILAGGLDAGNVAEAIRVVRPYAVDVSGGIESAKGIKDHDKMREFVNEVKRVECQA